MLQYRQINRLLTSIVASMVVLTSVATVEARLSEQQMAELTNQLRCECSQLMSDPRGQAELIRALRPHRAALEGSEQAMKVLHAGGFFSWHSTTAATLPELLVPQHVSTHQFITIPIDEALLSPRVLSRLSIRAPSC